MSEIKLVILGDGGVGKSAITIMFVQNHFITEYDPTIEDSYRKQFTVDDRVYLLDILDTAGQEEYCVMQDQYMRTGEVFIIVFSLTSRNSFEKTSALRTKIYNTKDLPTEEYIPMVLVGNKADIIDERMLTTTECKSLANSWSVQYIECSAATRQNIDEIFKTAVREMQKVIPIKYIRRSAKSKKCRLL